MIPLVLRAQAEAAEPYVVRLGREGGGSADALLLNDAEGPAMFASRHGLVELMDPHGPLDGDVVLVTPAEGRLERLLRAGSPHNTLLVTERCDQLCVMCSQPPKKTHVDRFAHFADACLLAKPDTLIGISGGEPTLFKPELFGFLEHVLRERPDLRFHVLTNAQHFEEQDVGRLRHPLWRRVAWGIPIYAADAPTHDRIVGKEGAFDRLELSLARLIRAGARIELRTVVLRDKATALRPLAGYVGTNLKAVEQWSIMQLEAAGFARSRWTQLVYDHAADFAPVAYAVDRAELSGVQVRLFNFQRCTVPPAYRDLAVASISDWKRRYAPGCSGCREVDACTGFFAWHPEDDMRGVRPL